jgi:exopolyphosphatase/guanosine-5'-triphosphate,3'-diphosphate pyrophosphatase
MTLGIIDVGTNSIHLLVGILGLNGKFHVLLKERDLTRLGQGGLVSGRLTAKARRRATEVLRRYAAALKQCQVDHIEAVATSAIREAANGRAFVKEIRRQLKLPLRIISGRQEARLIYLGVLQAPSRLPTLIVTIGGGSAQVVCGTGASLRYASSVQLGCARLAQQFIQHDPPRFEEVAALDRHVRRTWKPVARTVRRHRWSRVIGSSATIEQLMTAAHRLTHRRPASRLTISQQTLRSLVDWLLQSTAKERMRLPGLDPRREDLVLPTAVTLLAWMEACGVGRLAYAPGSLREGLVLDYLIRHHTRHGRVGPMRDLLENANGNGGPGRGTGARKLIISAQKVLDT